MSPPEQPVPTFEVSEEHKEVVVISGEVRCLNSREKLTAPCIVPRNVRYTAASRDRFSQGTSNFLSLNLRHFMYVCFTSPLPPHSPLPNTHRYLLMNTGNPKLLVIPAGMLRSEGSEGGSPQERVLFYRRKQRKLQERIVHVCQVIWHLLMQVCVCVCVCVVSVLWGTISVQYKHGPYVVSL